MSMIGRMILANDFIENSFDEVKFKEISKTVDFSDEVPFPEVERNVIFDNIDDLTAIRQEENNRLVGNVLEKIGMSIDEYLKIKRF